MVVAAPLLHTKLHVPSIRPGLVARNGLVDGLRRGGSERLTLLSAPAGSGKTTLLAQWVADLGEGRSAPAWVSLDASDNEPQRFWTYVVGALQRRSPGLGADALDLLQDPQSSSCDAALRSLINDLSGLPDRVTLVLDDFHVIDSPEVHTGMGFLLDHLPESVDLIIATRSDPALPLARLRGRGQLLELRAADLHFTSEEATDYFTQMGLTLTSDQLSVLQDRTEGWIAAMQLAALSLRGRADIAHFIEGFAGSDRYIVDYLLEEVLLTQTDDVREFLLRTSILDRLSGPLCDVVTGASQSSAMLNRLDRANLFLIPLDDHRRWYRYHHLFGDVLRARLLDDERDLVPDLHRRASAWWEGDGDQAEAIRHALAGQDFERAADLLERAIPDLARRRQEQTMREWLDAIPDTVYTKRPLLAIGYVGSRLVSGDLNGVEKRLRQAEQWLEDGLGGGMPAYRRREMVVHDDEAFRRLPASIAVYRTALSHARGEVDGALEQGTRALRLIGEEDHFERGGAAGFLALAHWSRGALDEAYHWWSQAATDLEQAGHVSDAIGAHVALADILIEQGRLRDARRTYERGLALAAAQTTQVRGVADMHVGLAGLHTEWNDLASAREHLHIAQGLQVRSALAQNPHRSKIAWARIAEAEGHFAAAADLLDEAEQLYQSDYFPDVRPISAMRARSWIRQGRLHEVNQWVLERGLSLQDDPSYLREFEHITLAKSLVADSSGAGEPALVPFLERLLTQAERGGRLGHVIEILTLQAIAHAGEHPAALSALARAMGAAEPEGYVRVFAGHGARLTPVLTALAERSDYARLLLSRLLDTPAARPARPGLVEPLTSRELDVLRLLDTDLTGPEMARRLFVSLNTVRTHTKSIYTKLGATSRRTALSRARELGLLTRT